MSSAETLSSGFTVAHSRARLDELDVSTWALSSLVRIGFTDTSIKFIRRCQGERPNWFVLATSDGEVRVYDTEGNHQSQHDVDLGYDPDDVYINNLDTPHIAVKNGTTIRVYRSGSELFNTGTITNLRYINISNNYLYSTVGTGVAGLQFRNLTDGSVVATHTRSVDGNNIYTICSDEAGGTVYSGYRDSSGSRYPHVFKCSVDRVVWDIRPSAFATGGPVYPKCSGDGSLITLRHQDIGRGNVYVYNTYGTRLDSYIPASGNFYIGHAVNPDGTLAAWARWNTTVARVIDNYGNANNIVLPANIYNNADSVECLIGGYAAFACVDGKIYIYDSAGVQQTSITYGLAATKLGWAIEDAAPNFEALKAGFQIRGPFADLGASFTVGQDFADLGASFTVGQDLENLAASFVVRRDGSEELPAEFVVGVLDGSEDLPAELTLRRSASQQLASEFITRHPDSEDLPGEFIIRPAGSRSLGAELIVRQPGSQDLFGELTIRRAASQSLSAGFTVRHSGSQNLAASFITQRILDLSGEFVVRRSLPQNLGAELVVRHPDSEDLPGEFIVRQAESTDLLGELVVRHPDSEDLPGEFTIRRSASENLGAGFIVRQAGSQDLAASFDGQVSLNLPGEFISRQAGSRSLPGALVVRHPDSEELPAEFIIRRSASGEFPVEFISRQPGSQDLLGGFVSRHSASQDLGASFDGQVSLNLSVKFAVRQPWPLWTNRYWLNGVVQLEEANLPDSSLEEIIIGVMNDIKTWLLAEGVGRYSTWTDIELTPRAIRRATTYGTVASLYARHIFGPRNPVIRLAPMDFKIFTTSEAAMEYWEGIMMRVLDLYLSGAEAPRIWIDTLQEDPVFTMEDIPLYTWDPDDYTVTVRK